MRDVLTLLISELKPYRRTIIVCSLLAMLAAAFDTLAPVALGRGFDLAGKHTPLFWYGSALLVWLVLRSIGEYLRSYIAYRGERVSSAVSEGYVARTLAIFLNKPLAFHYGKRGPEMSDKVMELRYTLENIIGAIVFDLVPAAIGTVAIIGYIITIEWRIALVLLTAIVAFVAYTFKTTPRILSNHRDWDEARRKIANVSWDALKNVLVVKSTTNEQFVGGLVEKYVRAMEPVVEKDLSYDRSVRDKQNLIIAFGSFAAVGIGVMDFRNGTFTLGHLTTIVAYAFTVFGYVRFCQWQARSYLRLVKSYAAVKSLHDESPEDFVSGEERRIAGDVEFRGVRFRYREDKSALEEVSFTVRCGERVAIVGESGEGKTTMVDILGRYYIPQSGEILIDGRDAREINLRSLRSQMAYVPQDLTLFHESIGFNIRYGRPDATDEDVREAARLTRLDTFIEGLPEKYDTIVGERGMKLSGGERQRVAIARAFLRDPSILVLDEPTAHLDSTTEEYVRQSLEMLMQGRTTFVIAHRLRTVMDADRILVLKDGRIVETGTHAQLAKKLDGAYAALLKAQGGLNGPDTSAETLSA